MSSEDQLVDILTKPFDKQQYFHLMSKLGLKNVFKPNLRGSVEGQNINKEKQIIKCSSLLSV